MTGYDHGFNKSAAARTSQRPVSSPAHTKKVGGAYPARSRRRLFGPPSVFQIKQSPSKIRIRESRESSTSSEQSGNQSKVQDELRKKRSRSIVVVLLSQATKFGGRRFPKARLDHFQPDFQNLDHVSDRPPGTTKKLLSPLAQLSQLPAVCQRLDRLSPTLRSLGDSERLAGRLAFRLTTRGATKSFSCLLMLFPC